MSLRHVPPRVRAHLYLFWVGAVAAALGILGFFLSFSSVGSPAQAAVDVHYDIPVLAYTSIFAWVIGLALMWYSRRQLNAAVAKKLAEDREAMFVDLGALGASPHDLVGAAPDESAVGALDDENAVDAPDGREP